MPPSSVRFPGADGRNARLDGSSLDGQQGEAKTMAAIISGTTDRSWGKAALKAGKCEGV